MGAFQKVGSYPDWVITPRGMIYYEDETSRWRKKLDMLIPVAFGALLTFTLALLNRLLLG